MRPATPPLQKRWTIAPPLPPEGEKKLSGYPPVLRQILYTRGHQDHTAAQQYLGARRPEGSDPFNLLGMEAAVDHIQWHMKQATPLVVYGDYDADGVTATALLVETLQKLGANVHPYIPNRFEEGYGLNRAALQGLRDDGTGLVITVDCGIRAVDEVEFARAIDLDLIITDHHQPGSELPNARAILNPKQPGDAYVDKELSGVGLAYKLAAGLFSRAHLDGLEADASLDLVALGTVSDLVPLVDENRALVREGLEWIRRPRRQGLLSLMGVAGLNPTQVNASHIGYILGPRLNAAGRLDSAIDAYELLLTDDRARAGRLAQHLDNQNRVRQKMTRETQLRAEQLSMAADSDSLLLFAADPDFNSGIVGLAASRLMELYYRPAIVAYQGEVDTRGSCRSIPEFHITQALDRCSDLLSRYGGHAAAAGFTVSNDNLPELEARLRTIAHEQLSDRDLRPTLHADVEIPFSELSPELIPQLELLEPTGHRNPNAVFVTRGLTVVGAKAVGRDGAHLKLSLRGDGITYDAIAFGQGHWHEHLTQRIDVLYAFELNEYQGRITPQLRVQDLKPSRST